MKYFDVKEGKKEIWKEINGHTEEEETDIEMKEATDKDGIGDDDEGSGGRS